MFGLFDKKQKEESYEFRPIPKIYMPPRHEFNNREIVYFMGKRAEFNRRIYSDIIEAEILIPDYGLIVVPYSQLKPVIRCNP